MITREDIQTVITETQPYATEVFITEMLNLVESEQSKYDALVDAAVAWYEWHSPDCAQNLIEAIKPFIKKKTSERLLESITKYKSGIEFDTDELHQIADEVRELEAELAQCLDCCKRVGELEEQVQEINVLKDRLENGIRYDDDTNRYIVVWTARELEEVKKESKKISKVLGLDDNGKVRDE